MEHDGTFCTDIEDFHEEVHSPTDSSEDSVEVKVEAISIRNKRKCAEPRRVQEGPLKKRMCLQAQVQPFRPWSRESMEKAEVAPFLGPTPVVPMDALAQAPSTERLTKVPGAPHGYFRPPSPIGPPSPAEPVALVKRREATCDGDCVKVKIEPEASRVPLHPHIDQDALRIPLHPQVAHMSAVDTERMLRTSAEAFPRLQQTKKEQRNYKNMTRERRIEANARERTRVHTISAAFDTLRRSIPAYSHSQKLSKLSVLRVACSYILTLSNMLTDDQREVPQCVEQVTKTIQREGKLRKKKDDTD